MTPDTLALKIAYELSESYGHEVVAETRKALGGANEDTGGSRSFGVPEWFYVAHFIVECSVLALGLRDLWKNRNHLAAAIAERAPATPKLSADKRKDIIDRVAKDVSDTE